MKALRVTTKFVVPEDIAIIKMLEEQLNKSAAVRELAVKGYKASRVKAKPKPARSTIRRTRRLFK